MRTINDVFPVSQVLTALQTVMLPNTRVQLAGGAIYVNDATSLVNMSATWPSVSLYEKGQNTARISYRTFQTRLQIVACYYDRWDGQQSSLSAIWSMVDLDLRRMKANVEDNPALYVSGTRNCEGTVEFVLSSYEGSAIAPTDGPFPVPVVMRTATISVNCLPYISNK